MNRKLLIMLTSIGLAAVLTTAFLHWQSARGGRASGPLAQDAYVWQRAWSEEVRAAVRRSSATFGSLVVLSAEVGWDSEKPHVARVELDYACLREAAVPVGLALRIGPYSGPFAETGEPVESLAALAAERLGQATTGGSVPCELQLDFDCPTFKLDGYRLWVNAIRRRIAPTPLVITALPSWLGSSAFKRLAAATDGFVLQVHSLERPRGPDQSMTLCDPDGARRAVEKASRIGVPFRVALATYGYFVAFDQQRQLIGLQADGPALTWPADAQVRVLQSDPVATADLVRGWSADRPASMRGLIWYRLPTDADTLNWRWPTLIAVMAGRTPQGKLEVDIRRPGPGLVELELVNTGDADAALPAEVTAAWASSRLLASDALAGFELDEADRGQARFRPGPEAELQWIAPGQHRMLGWLRFESDTEVEVHVTPTRR